MRRYMALDERRKDAQPLVPNRHDTHIRLHRRTRCRDGYMVPQAGSKSADTLSAELFVPERKLFLKKRAKSPELSQSLSGKSLAADARPSSSGARSHRHVNTKERAAKHLLPCEPTKGGTGGSSSRRKLCAARQKIGGGADAGLQLGARLTQRVSCLSELTYL